jgi:hypothetical protein
MVAEQLIATVTARTLQQRQLARNLVSQRMQQLFRYDFLIAQEAGELQE